MGIGCGSLHVHVPLVETLIWHIVAILGFLRMVCMCPKPKVPCISAESAYRNERSRQGHITGYHQMDGYPV